MSVNKPTTSDMRIAFSIHYIDGANIAEMSALFDAWLASVERAAAEKAWDECLKQMPFDLDWKIQYGDLNPHRREDA